MPLQNIVLHLDSGRACAARLDYALTLASEHGAHLTGVYVTGAPAIPGSVEAFIGNDIIATRKQLARQGAVDQQKLFEGRLQTTDVSGEWRCAEGDPLEILSLHGRYADLVIVGQYDSHHPAPETPPDLGEMLVFALGRPVLVVPYGGGPATVQERILVAWDAGREATRAVNDALPLLRRAKHVVVMAINPEGNGKGHGEIASADICLHLARHGVKAEADRTQARDIGVGDMLLSRAADKGADLIVMGAYGHARVRELILGGVTQTMFDHMTVPVLMSH
jgi:nucleotide-binding universal stress UspA family protein